MKYVIAFVFVLNCCFLVWLSCISLPDNSYVNLGVDELSNKTSKDLLKKHNHINKKLAGDKSVKTVGSNLPEKFVIKDSGIVEYEIGGVKRVAFAVDSRENNTTKLTAQNFLLKTKENALSQLYGQFRLVLPIGITVTVVNAILILGFAVCIYNSSSVNKEEPKDSSE